MLERKGCRDLPQDVLTEIPIERVNPTSLYHPGGMHHGSTNVRESYLLSDDHRYFDAQFFNINPVEANSMDPQQRLLLEMVYESIESAGLPLEGLRGSSMAVFVGLMCEEYSNHLLRDPDSTPIYMATGTARSITSNQISYFFDWLGPSMTIDTACSPSLVAVNQAVGALRSGESHVAVAADANLILSVGGAAQNVSMLIAGRAIQGIGGKLLVKFERYLPFHHVSFVLITTGMGCDSAKIQFFHNCLGMFLGNYSSWVLVHPEHFPSCDSSSTTRKRWCNSNRYLGICS